MYIRIPMGEAAVINDPMTFETVLVVNTMETLDTIIQQCRDIKLSIMNGEK